MEETRPQQVGPWAVRVRRQDAPALAALRLTPRVEACETGAEVWARGSALTDELRLALRKAAPDAWYTVSPDGATIPQGALLPEGRLPDGPWLPLNELLPVHVPSAALPGQPPPQVPLRIIRGGTVREPSVLVTPLSQWAQYANAAPAVRLRPLRFAATDSLALLWGTPLPPIPGTPHVERSGIAVPCGHAWSPPVDSESLATLLRLQQGDLALFDLDGSWQLIPAGAFVQARRSAVRMTVDRGDMP